MTNFFSDRPLTTLFMLMSVDGKISTGSTDVLDFDKDLIAIDGVKEGLPQYYKIEKTTDWWSLNSGKVQAKIGVNERKADVKKDVCFVVIDNKNLTEDGVRYFCRTSERFILVTTNPDHPAFDVVQEEKMSIIYQDSLNLKEMLKILKQDYGCERITIQTGGTLNSLFLRGKLIDYVDIVIAPVLVGGSETPTVIDGKSLTMQSQLNELGVLELESCEVLRHNYVRLKYKVIN